MIHYKNKEEMASEETPIMLRLERRHTMMGGEPEMDKHRRTSRTHSVDCLGPAGNITPYLDPASKIRTPLSQDVCSTRAGASTVVITESELSSSWLYNSLKAKINPNEETFPDSTMNTSTSLENLLPEAPQDPEVKVAPVPKQPRPESCCTSCCCYVAIGIIVSFASIGILAAIGGIVYMEMFTVHATNQSVTSIPDGHGKTENLLRVEKIGKELGNEKLEVVSPLGVTKMASDAALHTRTETPSEGDATSFQDNVDEENNLSVDENINDVFPAPNQGISISANESSLEAPNSPKKVKSNLSNILPSLEENSSEISLLEKFELPTASEDDLQKRLSINENKNLNSSIDAQSKNAKEAEDNDLNEDDKNNSNSNNEEIETKKPRSEETSPSDSNLNIHEPSPFFNDQRDFSDDAIHNVSGELLKESNTSVLPNFNLTMQSGSILNTQSSELEVLPSTDEDVAGRISESDDKDKHQLDSDFDQLVPMNQTSDESKAALEFFKRLGFERDRILSHPAVKVDDMHVKFSLDEALKYLRSLDANNQLPSSRRKTTIPRNDKINLNKKRNVDVGAERRVYLQKLREKIYD